MKKILLLMMSFFGIVLAALAQSTATFDFTNPTGLNPSVTPSEEASKGVVVSDHVFTDNGVTLVATKGTSDAVVFTGTEAKGYAKELRAYKGATVTITAPAGKNVTNVSLTGTAAGGFTAAEGTFESKTWTGSASSVVLTVTATVKVNTVTVTYAAPGSAGGEGGGTGEGGGEVTPTPPAGDTQVLFSETFNSDFGSFTMDNKTLPTGVSYVWAYASYNGSGYAKASAYVSGKSYATESWLVSPEVDFTKASKLSLTFDHAINKGNAEKMTELHKLYVKEVGGEWKEVAITTWPAGTDWTFVTTTQDLSAYDGKKIQFAFAYNSTEESAATWEVKNVKIEGLGEVVVPEPEVPHYANLADMQAAATTTKAAATLTADNILVTGVAKKGTNYTVYVTDGTTSAILYGANEPNCKKGDKLAGTLSGNAMVYNLSLELDAANYENVTVASSDNEVTPSVVTIADLGNDKTGAYQSRYVRLENVNFEKSALESYNVNLLDDSDNSIVLRDNFQVLTDVVFDTEKPYNVDAYVVYYKGAAQLYACSAEDLHIITTLKDAETAWGLDEVVVIPNHELEVNELRTLSDGVKTFTSSNEKVATVDAEGYITFVGYGHTTITVETPETAEYLASKASYELYYIEGEGTIEKPYTASDVEYFNGKTTDKVWVKGTILGYISDTKTGAYSPADDNTLNTNLAVGVDGDNYVTVQLPKGNVRDALNLVDHADLQGTTVWLYGTLATYCGKAGVKNVTEYSLDGVTGIDTVIGNESQSELRIFDLQGRKLQQPVKGINIVNGRKVLVK